jgi:hypothetical protein
MPRYYFHIQNGRFLEDKEGTELPAQVLREEAVNGARSLMAEGLGLGFNRMDWAFEVADEHGGRALTLPFSEALRKEH